MIPVDYKDLLNAADKLVTASEQIEKCENCFPGAWCLDHANAYDDAFLEMRKAIGREKQLDN